MISLLRTISFGYIAQHRTRSLLVVLSIALGVATLVATQAISRGLKGSLQDAVNPLAGIADLIVIKGGAGLPASLAREIRQAALPGIEDARPFVFARVALVELDNRPIWLFGLEMPDELKRDAKAFLSENSLGIRTSLRTPSLVELPTWIAKLQAGEVGLVSVDVSEALKSRGVSGTTFSLRNAGRTPHFLLLGTVDFSASPMPVGGAVAVLPLDAASSVCYPEKVGTVQQINIRLAPGADQATAQQHLQRWLGVRGDVQTIDTNRAALSDVTSGLEVGLLIGSAGALVVGLFLVYNALSVSVAERRRDIGILRAVGATRGQIAGLFLGESLIMGLVGSGLGLPLGWLLAWLAVKPLAGVISEMLVPIEGATVQMPFWLAIVALISGTLAAVFAALLPALQAAQEEPAEAVRRLHRSRPWVAIILQLSIVVTLIVLGILFVVYRSAFPKLVGIFAGIVFLLLGGLTSTPLLTAFFGRLFQPLFRYILGLEGRLAADSLVRSPGRTGLVIAALAATSGLLVQTSGFLKSTREAISNWIEDKIAADLFVSCGSSITAGGAALTMDRGLGERLAAVPDVDIVLPVRFQKLDYTSPVDGSPKLVWLASVDLKAFDRSSTERPLAKSFARLPRLREPGTVAVSENFAYLYGVKVGDRLQLPGRNKELTVEVVGTVVDYTWNRGTVLMNLDSFRREFGDEQIDVYDIFLKPGANAVHVKQTIKEQFGKTDAVFVVDRPEVYRELNNGLNKIYSLAYAQQVVIGLVALMGVVSALFISVIQRQRDLGLLRAIGATRSQILRSVLAEAVLMGLVGAVIGFVIGLALEWYVIYLLVMDESGFIFPLCVPWIEGGIVTLACVSLATIAGFWPAYLATRLNITEAITYE